MPESSRRPGRPRAAPGTGAASVPCGPPGPRILADRIAAVLSRHEPGWQLPRASELARRHEVSDAEMVTVIDYLVERQLVRRTPGGRLYRAGPADYLVSLENMPGLGTTVDPLGRELSCVNYTIERLPMPEDAARALGIRSGEPAGVLRLIWALDDRVAAMSTTYLAAGLPEPRALTRWIADATAAGTVPMRPPSAARDDSYRDLRSGAAPLAVSVQMELPPKSVARRLHLAASQMAVLVTALFGDQPGRCPAALTSTVLRPDMFRITVDTTAAEAGSHGLPAARSPADVDPGR